MDQIVSDENTLGPIDPNGPTTLHEDVADKLRDMIFSGELQDETRVPEKALCEKFGISRTPLREALKVLAHEGLISLLPNRGARVTKVTPDDIDEVFPVMGALEAVAGKRLVRKSAKKGSLKFVRYITKWHFIIPVASGWSTFR